jgi:catechol 2,3-dioxygenase-like lactoylglutathione lyase family enzyme
MIRISLASVFVADQDKALKFYTETLGFVKKHDIPMGPFRWLTVTSPAGGAEVELVLEPMAFAPAQVYQKALHDAGVPLTAFTVDDIHKEYTRLKALGVAFKSAPQDLGPVIVAMFDDTCGNFIQLAQPK